MAATLDELRQYIEDVGLARIADKLVSRAQPSVRLHTNTVQEDMLAIGASKIGGTPDLPPGTEWPARAGNPLAFIAQIALREFSSHDRERVLPLNGLLFNGLLSFFYDADEQPWGFDPKDADGWKVLYTPSDTPLARVAIAPEVLRLGQFPACSIELAQEWTVPDLASGDEALRDLTDDESEAYFDLDTTLYYPRPGLPDNTHLNRLLGYPQHVQGEMRLECQLASQGVYCGDADSYQSEAAQALAPGASDWRLLFQIDSDSNAEMMWGDCGRLYYWIRQQDIAACKFDAVWLVLQCG